MVLHTPQPVWRYAYFQIPAILTGLFLALAILTSAFRWFPPNVSVQMMLDLSSSTYQSTSVFRGPGTIMEAEIEAVKEYARQNIRAENPNLLSLAGFADRVQSITPAFSNNSSEIDRSLDQVVQPNIILQVGGGTDLSLAIEKGLDSLNSQTGRCKEILVITDGEAQLRENLVFQAMNNSVRLNFLIVGQGVPNNLDSIAVKTGGLALSANLSNIRDLVADKFRQRFNANERRVNFFLGLAFVSLMWLLVLPLDRFLQIHRKMSFEWAGKIALLNALFWTLFIGLRIGFPFLSGC
jgi:Ca-activated chloride channel homolog